MSRTVDVESTRPALPSISVEPNDEPKADATTKRPKKINK